MGSRRGPRIGLVFGAGGVVGGAWAAGALAALVRETGWEPWQATHIVGTSAGAVFAALASCRVPTARLLPRPRESWLLADLAEAHLFQPRAPQVWRPGSWRLSTAALARRPTPFSLLRALSGVVPPGRISTAPIEQTIRRVAPSGWAPHPACWVVATDYASGARTVFGRTGAPLTDLGLAVAASCAIPGFFQPVQIEGRAYVDGGLHSLTNLDLLSGLGLDLVLCLSPMSCRALERRLGPEDLFAALVSRVAAADVDRAAAQLEREGTEVVLVEPGRREAALMGTDMMAMGHCAQLPELALRAVTARLRGSELQRRLEPLRAA